MEERIYGTTSDKTHRDRCAGRAAGKAAEYYKTVFRMEEKDRSPNGGIYLSDGHICLALINTRSQKPAPNHFGFQVGSIPHIEEATHTTAQDNVPGARAEKWIRDPEGNRVDISEDGWPI